MHGRGHVRPCLIEFSSVTLRCFTFSRLAIFTDVSLRKPEDSLSPLFKAILYSVSRFRKLVNKVTNFVLPLNDPFMVDWTVKYPAAE